VQGSAVFESHVAQAPHDVQRPGIMPGLGSDQRLIGMDEHRSTARPCDVRREVAHDVVVAEQRRRDRVGDRMLEQSAEHRIEVDEVEDAHIPIVRIEVVDAGAPPSAVRLVARQPQSLDHLRDLVAVQHSWHHSTAVGIDVRHHLGEAPRTPLASHERPSLTHRCWFARATSARAVQLLTVWSTMFMSNDIALRNSSTSTPSGPAVYAYGCSARTKKPSPRRWYAHP